MWEFMQNPSVTQRLTEWERCCGQCLPLCAHKEKERHTKAERAEGTMALGPTCAPPPKHNERIWWLRWERGIEASLRGVALSLYRLITTGRGHGLLYP